MSVAGALSKAEPLRAWRSRPPAHPQGARAPRRTPRRRSWS